MKKTAIILGATGLTGGALLQLLLADPEFEKICLFSRRATGISHPKITEYITDLFALEKEEKAFQGNVVFCCIGTTKAKTPDKEKYRKIDFGIPVSAARLCKHNGIETFMVISAMGANPNSSIFYNRTKGEMEREVLQAHIPNTYILQPSLIGGKRQERRLGEQIAKIFMKVFGFLVPEKYKMIAPETIAKAMQVLSKGGYRGNRISSDRIMKIAYES
jgi:uncharacterized protein YbjT (DUF2867 family)